MKENIQPIILTQEQIHERDFLQGISHALLAQNMSALDLKTLPGQHRVHNVLFDNYEFNIMRTPVFVYKNKIAQLLGIGDWLYQGGIYERYEISVTENAQNKRVRDIVRYTTDVPRKTHNVIMHRGTMATDRGFYMPSKHEFTDSDDEIFYNQNAHLFMPARQIYNILDQEYYIRQKRTQEYILPDITDEQDLQIARMRMLESVKNRQK